MSLETYNTAQGAYAEPKHQEYSESFDPGEDDGDAGDAHAVLLEASGAYSPPDKSVVADAYSSTELSSKEESDPISGVLIFDPVLGEPVFHAAPGGARESGTAQEATSERGPEAVSEGATEPESESDSEKTESVSGEKEGGYGHVFSEVGAGMVEELVEHPGRVVASAAVGIVSAAMMALALPEIAVVAAVGAGVYGALSLLTAAPEWFRQADVAANPDQHTEAEVKEAEAELRSIGAGVVDVTASIIATPIGGIAGKMLERPLNAYMTRTLTNATTESAEAAAGSSIGSGATSGATKANVTEQSLSAKLANHKDALLENLEYGAINYAGDPLLMLEAQTAALGMGVLDQSTRLENR